MSEPRYADPEDVNDYSSIVNQTISKKISKENPLKPEASKPPFLALAIAIVCIPLLVFLIAVKLKKP